MATKIRLTRRGTKKKPFYRIVVCDSRSPRDGKFIEVVGYYNPRTSPPLIHADKEKIAGWIQKGAQISPTVKKLLKLQAKIA